MRRMARAFMNILSLADLSKDIGLAGPAVTGMFLPLHHFRRSTQKSPRDVLEVMKYHARFSYRQHAGFLAVAV